MKLKFSNSRRLLATGSLTAIALMLAFVPFNMGGCSANNVDIASVVQGGSKMLQSQQLSEKDEDSIGQSVAVQATNRWHIYQDDNLNRYVTLVARVVAASSGEAHIKPNVAVLDTPDVNAFSGPHGYIFITRGALQRIHDESELAGVLGHEVGHLTRHHGLNAVKSAGFMDGFLTAAKGSNDQVRAFGGVADGASEAVINKGFSQPQEEEADKFGVRYVIAAGYDPNGFLHFLQRIQQEQGNGGKPFGTHPGIGDRIQKIREQITKPSAGGQGAVLADRYQQFVSVK